MQEKKKKNLFGIILGNKILRIISLVLALAIAVGITVFCMYDREEEVDTEYIISTIKKSNKLITAELHYKGITEYDDKGLPIINKSNFIMFYEATANIGINVKKVNVESNEVSKTVTLTIPKAEVLGVKIEADKIKYYDEKFSLFNINSKEDANKAISEAEKKAIKEIQEMGALEMADKQAEVLVKGLISDLVPKGYKIKIKK